MNRIASALLLLLLTTCLSFADGKAFSAKLLREKNPSIPTQRAILKYEDGIETMIVESAIAGPKGEYGWVVPVPSKPLFVKPVRPEYLRESFRRVRPSVQPLYPPDTFAYFFCFLITILALTFALRYRKGVRTSRVTGLIGEILVVLLISILFPVFGGGDSTKGIVGHQNYGTIGAYEVKAIQDEDGTAVLDWLDTNGFHIPDESRAAVKDYASEGWWFLVSRFRKDSETSLPAHPLKVVFKSDKLVYPMRLTGTQGTDVYLELLVIAEQQANIPQLRLRSRASGSLNVRVPGQKPEEGEIYSEWNGTAYTVAQNDDVRTYYNGAVRPDQMKEDFHITLEPMQGEFTATMFDREEAKTAIWHQAIYALPFVSIGLGGLLLFAKQRVGRLTAIAAGATVLLSSIYGLGWYGSVEKVETVKLSRQKYMELNEADRELDRSVRQSRKR
ncbi:MAG: DUF2330 domain-containing protein [Fimbriimonadaceae bacterium]|nr:DUF2330 domain-containing protein [Fimbriimonadaceae bacterium]